MRLGISHIQWPLTFKYDLTKAFEHPPAAKLRYRLRILWGLFDLRGRRPRNLSLLRFRKLLLSHARRFSTIAFALIFLMLFARQNIRQLFCALQKFERNIQIRSDINNAFIMNYVNLSLIITIQKYQVK